MMVLPVVDRLYVYDNSVDGQDAKLQFRLVDGAVKKIYVPEIPEWAQALLPWKFIGNGKPVLCFSMSRSRSGEYRQTRRGKKCKEKALFYAQKWYLITKGLQTGRRKEKIQGTYFEISGSDFKIPQTFFWPRPAPACATQTNTAAKTVKSRKGGTVLRIIQDLSNCFLG